jgi:hypothetical protein
MTISKGELWFAPNVRMAELDLEDSSSLIDPFEKRVRGFFLTPAAFLHEMPEKDSGLFASALICAATIEFIARIDPALHGEPRPIAGWLKQYIPEFSEMVSGRTAAEFFEERFRNGLAHNGYIASLGRLCDIDGLISIDQDIVIINPFELIKRISAWLDTFVSDLRSRRLDIRAFQHKLKELFSEEVDRARQEV